MDVAGTRSSGLMFAVSLLLTVGAPPAMAQGSRTRLTDGAYTSAQADRGKITYSAKCAECHKADLAGVADRGPALSDDAFLINWESESLGRLFSKISETMPPRDLGSGPSDEDTVDLVSYILQINGYPAGSDELKPGRALDQIEIVRQSGRSLKQPTNFAVVQTIGCLTNGPGSAWTLTNASDPALTRDQRSTSAAQKAAAQPLGPNTFVLLSVAQFGPASYKGHKVEAKGLMYRSPDENLIDVTSLQTVASSCQPN
jgi:cytochrome c5